MNLGIQTYNLQHKWKFTNKKSGIWPPVMVFQKAPDNGDLATSMGRKKHRHFWFFHGKSIWLVGKSIISRCFTSWNQGVLNYLYSVGRVDPAKDVFHCFSTCSIMNERKATWLHDRTPVWVFSTHSRFVNWDHHTR